jgi:very-short-patch-repair endonuclease
MRGRPVRSGKALRVRGVSRLRNPRLPPRVENSRPQRFAASEILSRPDVTVKPQTLAESLMYGGGTDIEQIIRGAARELNFQFDAEQYVIPIDITGSYTIVDFVTFKPRRAVYPQGKQHYLRLDAYQQDFIQDLFLRSEGWMVFRPSWRRIYADPLGVMREIILGIETFTGQDPG